MGDSLQSKWFMLTRLSGWSVQAAKLGLRYDMPAEWVASALPTASIGFKYEVRSGDANADGWHVADWVYDRNSPDLECRDPVGATLSSRKPMVVCLQQDGVVPLPSSAADLAGKVLVISPGNGRLLSIEMGGEGLVQILPYTFVRDSGARDGSHWPYGDEEVFARRVRSLGAALASSSTDDTLIETWTDAARSLGIRVYGASGSVLLAPGFDVVPDNEDAKGWIIRSCAPGDKATGGTCNAVLTVPAGSPAIAIVSKAGCTSQLPAEIAARSVLVVSPGNGRLVIIEMDPHGLVSILPQDFR